MIFSFLLYSLSTKILLVKQLFMQLITFHSLERLMHEITTIDGELKKIESEKCVLLDTRLLVLNFQSTMCESERNVQGILVPEKLRKTFSKVIYF